ncbi:MAG TPA: type II toxin-antitoxin system VapC family toxin [Stellaceae bacterium]|nr:type II toxin-antitoxin system VapC family toxin [Stellaceae bacterium]
MQQGSWILKYLLDTCVISEMSKSRPDANVLAWFAGTLEVDLYLPVVTIGELRKGIEIARPKHATAAKLYETMLDQLVLNYAHRILPFDLAAAQLWGAFMAASQSQTVEDAQIAAIAASRGMTVVTCNVTHFQKFPVPIHNPF